jgi:hypothetical protein
MGFNSQKKRQNLVSTFSIISDAACRLNNFTFLGSAFFLRADPTSITLDQRTILQAFPEETDVDKNFRFDVGDSCTAESGDCCVPQTFVHIKSGTVKCIIISVQIYSLLFRLTARSALVRR